MNKHELWVVWVQQGGSRHVYGPMGRVAASSLYKAIHKNRLAMNINGHGMKTKALFDADEALRKQGDWSAETLAHCGI